MSDKNVESEDTKGVNPAPDTANPQTSVASNGAEAEEEKKTGKSDGEAVETKTKTKAKKAAKAEGETPDGLPSPCNTPSCAPVVSLIFLLSAIVVGVYVNSDQYNSTAMPGSVQAWYEQGTLIPFRDGTSDTKVFINTAGSKNSPETIVLVPDVSGSSYNYQHVFSALSSSGHRVVTFDFPGFGLTESAALPAAADVIVQAGYIATLFRMLALRPAHLVCQGSALAVCHRFAAQHASKVRSVTAFGSPTAWKALTFPSPFLSALGLASYPCQLPGDSEAAAAYLHRYRGHAKGIEQTCAVRKMETTPDTLSWPSSVAVAGLSESDGGVMYTAGTAASTSSPCLHVEHPGEVAQAVKAFIASLPPTPPPPPEEIPQHILDQMAHGHGHHHGHHGHDHGHGHGHGFGMHGGVHGHDHAHHDHSHGHGHDHGHTHSHSHNHHDHDHHDHDHHDHDHHDHDHDHHGHDHGHGHHHHH